jgi:hypothetical protein
MKVLHHPFIEFLISDIVIATDFNASDHILLTFAFDNQGILLGFTLNARSSDKLCWFILPLSSPLVRPYKSETHLQERVESF